uniref:ORF65 n=1 Tax=Malaco herpesvirus 2 TaxID=3031798 RepID=A0AA48P893_9VIRU|nr:TPA_asm: ORF65 [Malaco herpesvirus 2]
MFEACIISNCLFEQVDSTIPNICIPFILETKNLYRCPTHNVYHACGSGNSGDSYCSRTITLLPNKVHKIICAFTQKSINNVHYFTKSPITSINKVSIRFERDYYNKYNFKTALIDNKIVISNCLIDTLYIHFVNKTRKLFINKKEIDDRTLKIAQDLFTIIYKCVLEHATPNVVEKRQIAKTLGSNRNPNSDFKKDTILLIDYHIYLKKCCNISLI